MNNESKSKVLGKGITALFYPKLISREHLSRGSRCRRECSKLIEMGGASGDGDAGWSEGLWKGNCCSVEEQKEREKRLLQSV